MARVILIEPNALANPSIRVMPTLYKTLWLYLLTSVDHCGVWIVDWEMASLMVGGKIDIDYARKLFLETEDGSNNPKAVEFDKGRKWFLCKFLQFQSPEGLFSNAPWAKSIRKTAEKHGICLKTMMPYELQNKPLNEPLTKPFGQPYSIVQDIDSNINSEVSIISIEGGVGGDWEFRSQLYLDFLNAYGQFGRAPKRGAIEQSLLDAVRHLQSLKPEATYQECGAFLIAQAEQTCRLDENNGNTKRLNPDTWLQNRVYETNLNLIKQPKKQTHLDRIDAAIEALKLKHQKERDQNG
jgi:hypothetical protein